MKTLTHPLVPAVLLGALLALGSHARAGALPPVQHEGGIEYLSGGVGQDEARAIEQAGRHWPLTLEFAVQDGKRADFTADVQVLVRDARRHTVLQTTTQGPFLLARLRPGHYTVEATRQGQTRHQAVTVARSHAAHAVFVWPAAAKAPRA